MPSKHLPEMNSADANGAEEYALGLSTCRTGSLEETAFQSIRLNSH